MLTFKEFLESLMLGPDVPRQFISDNLIKPITKAYINNNIHDTEDEHVKKIYTKDGRIYLYIEEGVRIGATLIESEWIKNKLCYVPELSKKFEDEFKGVLHKLYKVANKDLNEPIFSNKIQTIDSSSVWIEWFKNPSEYGIKKIYTSPKGLTDLKDIWGKNKKHKDVRVVVEFK